MRHASRLLQPLRSCLSSVWVPFECELLNLSRQRVLCYGSQALQRLPAVQQHYPFSAANRHMAALTHKDTEVDEINRMFAECRDEIEMTREVGSLELRQWTVHCLGACERLQLTQPCRQE